MNEYYLWVSGVLVDSNSKSILFDSSLLREHKTMLGEAWRRKNINEIQIIYDPHKLYTAKEKQLDGCDVDGNIA